MMLDVMLLAAGDDVRGPEFGKAGPLGLAVIVILLAVTFQLVRSMNKHVSKLPESFDDPEPDDRADAEQALCAGGVRGAGGDGALSAHAGANRQ